MKIKEIAILWATLTLLAIAAGFLTHLQKVQKLGQPGVKIVQEPVTNNAGVILAPVSVYLPKQIPSFVSKELPVTDVEFNTLPKDTTYGRRNYRSFDGFECNASVVLMGSDRTSIHKPQYCLVGQGWKLEKTEVETVRMQLPQPYDLRVMKLTLSITVNKGDKIIPVRGIYTYWFVADGELTPNHWERMVMTARDMLTSNVLQRWAYISYFAYGSPGQEDAVFARMKNLMITTVPQFQIASGSAAKNVAAMQEETPDQQSQPLANLSARQ